MTRLVRTRIVLISIGIAIGTMFISGPFIGKIGGAWLGLGVGIISAITFLIKPKLLGALYKDPIWLDDDPVEESKK